MCVCVCLCVCAHAHMQAQAFHFPSSQHRLGCQDSPDVNLLKLQEKGREGPRPQRVSSRSPGALCSEGSWRLCFHTRAQTVEVNVDPGAETPVEEVEDQRERSALFLSVTIIYYLLRWFPGPVFKNPPRLVKDHRFIFNFFKPPLHQQPRSLEKKSIGV